MPGFGRNLLGAASNNLAAGPIYNPYTKQFAPGGIRGVRIGLGVAQQAGGPVGGIAGMLGNWLYTRNSPQAQAWDAGVRGGKGLLAQFAQSQQDLHDWASGQRPQVDNVGAPNGVAIGDPSMADPSQQQPAPTAIASGDPYGGQNAMPAFPTTQPVTSRPIGGTLNYGGIGPGGGIHYNNGVGAGTGYGAGTIMNDGWGDAARGFGIGATSAGSGGNFALMDAMSQNKRNRV